MLAALITHAVRHIIASRRLQKLRPESRVELWFGALPLAGGLLVDVLEGMIIGLLASLAFVICRTTRPHIGLLASLAFVIYRTTRPHIASLGRVPGVPGAYSDAIRHPANTPVPGVLIVRLVAQLYHANALTMRGRVKAVIAERVSPLRAVIFDAAAQGEIDVTSAGVMRGLLKESRDNGIEIYFAEIHPPVLDFGRRTGLLESIGEDHVISTADAAVRHLLENA